MTLVLSEMEETKLPKRATAEGTTVEALIQGALASILAGQSSPQEASRETPKSLLGLWAEFGPGPSAEEIDENRAEMFASFGREDIL